MNPQKLLLLTSVLLISLSLSSQDGESRYKFFDVTNYSFHIELNDSTDIIYGEAKISINFIQKTDSLILDFANLKTSGKGMKISTITEENTAISYSHINNKIAIPLTNYSELAAHVYTIRYSGIPEDGLIISQNKFGDRTFFGDNWPNRAHQWLPCIDHPADKASLSFTVVAPERYQVVSNGVVKSEISKGGFKSTTWVNTIPLSTKLMVIGVADFAKQDLASVSGVPVSTWVYPQNKTEGFLDYSAAIKPMVYFSNLIAPFPFEKLANVQSTTLYGGMENASCIFYAEQSVTGKARAERLMAHEIAHQWFGDALSEKDWYHIWLSEGFATYLTGMYIEQNYGRAAFLRHINAEKQEVFDFEKIHLAPIIDTTLTISPRLLSPNTYQKASWVLHMLRNELGDSIFTKCLQSFYGDYKFKNALTTDFLEVIEKVSGKDYDKFFDQWLYKSGHPVLEISWIYKDHQLVLKTKQIQKNTLFEFPLDIKVINKNSVSTNLNIQINSEEQIFTFNYLNNPIEIIADPGNNLLLESSISQEK
jgi:aminopeptidase N